jgi:hypothetical protein
MLFGYLSGKTEFDEPDVEEVAREIHEETMGSTTQIGTGLSPAVPSPYSQSNTAGTGIDGGFSGDPVALLASLNVQQFGERLGRLERSLLQLEKINSTTLSLLQQLVSNGSQIAQPAMESEKINA